MKKNTKRTIEEIKKEIIVSHSDDGKFDCLRQDLNWLLSQYEEEVKQHYKAQIKEAFKGHPKTIFVRLSDVLSLLAGKEGEE